jgi:hypothetical protein
MNNFHKLILLNFQEKLLFFEAVFFLYIAKLVIVIFPFRISIKTIKKINYEEKNNLNRLSSIKIAINRASKLSLWRNRCLPRSFAGRWMISKRKINSTIFIGVKHDEGKFKAHAWLTSHDIEIVPKEEEFNVLLKL